MLAAAEAPPRERRRHLRSWATRRCTCRGSGPTASPTAWSTSTTTSGWAARAYGELARAGRAADAIRYGDVYDELADNFARFVDVLVLISRRIATPTSDRDILRLYDSGCGPQSAAAARLAALGVVPPKGDGRLQ